jgi:hypothetical protein
MSLTRTTSIPCFLPLQLLHHLSSRPDLYESIIISDANSWFIQQILEAKGLQGVFSQVRAVIQMAGLHVASQ